MDLWICFMAFAVLVTMITILANCLCCRKQEMKNDYLGLEGMVKLTNPDDPLVSQSTIVSVEPNKGSNSDTESKRTTITAPHRSLPDIPVVETTGDNNSELYATVGDKVQELPQGRSPTTSLKRQTVSQHSSISQADDVSSPYARVKSPVHAYDKLRIAEHPYAQLVQPGTSSSGKPTSSLSALVAGSVESVSDDSITRRASHQNLDEPTVEIPAASAIAGIIQASQDLPYMTPPIVQPQGQHFSGDSQDSSKGYTSISVREPLANLIPHPQAATTAQRRQILGDSHYATVSDDSDEMYAAIEDPNNTGDLYTSGSETYAQIQPPNAMTVSVEINTIPQPQADPVEPSATSSTTASYSVVNKRINAIPEETPPPPSVDSLKAHSFAHSRQASSSSCTSSVGNLGSPKPEKRQANSPLPPTPKTLKTQSGSFFSSSNLTSTSSISVQSAGRNSIIEVNCNTNNGNKSEKDNGSLPSGGGVEVSKKKHSPSKDLEGMYAKVMKKNKLSSVPSQDESPVLARKSLNYNEFGTSLSGVDLHISDNDVAAIPKSPQKPMMIDNDYETMIEKKRTKNNNYNNKDPGYETIPGDRERNVNNNIIGKVPDYAQIGQKAKPNFLAQGIHRVSENSLAIFHEVDKYSTHEDSEAGYESLKGHDPGYETLNRNEPDFEPNYEILRPKSESIKPKNILKDMGDIEEDDVPGYSSIKEKRTSEDDPRYSVIQEKKPKNHDYASIAEAKLAERDDEDDGSDIYSSIPANPSSLNVFESNNNNNNNNFVLKSPGYSSISDTRTTPTPSTEDFSTSSTEPNYESVRYLNVKENPYERLSSTPDSQTPTPTLQPPSLSSSSQSSSHKDSNSLENGVADYFQV